VEGNELWKELKTMRIILGIFALTILALIVYVLQSDNSEEHRTIEMPKEIVKKKDSVHISEKSKNSLSEKIVEKSKKKKEEAFALKEKKNELKQVTEREQEEILQNETEEGESVEMEDESDERILEIEEKSGLTDLSDEDNTPFETEKVESEFLQ
jgi:hypothetical protein